MSRVTASSCDSDLYLETINQLGTRKMKGPFRHVVMTAGEIYYQRCCLLSPWALSLSTSLLLLLLVDPLSLINLSHGANHKGLRSSRRLSHIYVRL